MEHPMRTGLPRNRPRLPRDSLLDFPLADEPQSVSRRCLRNGRQTHFRRKDCELFQWVQ